MYERQNIVTVRKITYAEAGAMGALALAGLGLMRGNPLALAGAFLVYKATRKSPREVLRQNIVPFLPAPGEIKKSVNILAAPDVVFQQISDLSVLETVFPAAKDLSLHGAQQARLAFGLPLNKEIPVFLKIKDVVEKRVAEFELTAGDKPLGSCTVEILDSLMGDGTTLEMIAHTKPVMGVVGRNTIKPFVTFAMDTYLFRIKQLCETGEIARTKGV